MNPVSLVATGDGNQLRLEETTGGGVGVGRGPGSWLGLTALINFIRSPRVTELSAQSDGPCQDMIH